MVEPEDIGAKELTEPGIFEPLIKDLRNIESKEEKYNTTMGFLSSLEESISFRDVFFLAFLEDDVRKVITYPLATHYIKQEMGNVTLTPDQEKIYDLKKGLLQLFARSNNHLRDICTDEDKFKEVKLSKDMTNLARKFPEANIIVDKYLSGLTMRCGDLCSLYEKGLGSDDPEPKVDFGHGFSAFTHYPNLYFRYFTVIGERRSVDRNILVVDDSYPDKWLEAVLAYGFDEKRSASAESGEDALKKLESEKYDVVLTDLDLGDGIDGVELVKKINKRDGSKYLDIFSSSKELLEAAKEEIGELIMNGNMGSYTKTNFRPSYVLDDLEQKIKLNNRNN